MKIQVAVAVQNAIAAGRLDGSAPRLVPARDRTPGPVGMSLMQDEVSLSVRDLVVAMLTISDNVATDELIALVGLDQINQTTRALGLVHTQIISNVRHMLDDVAREIGFTDYRALAAHDPRGAEGSASEQEIRRRLAGCASLDPAGRTRTRAAETVALLRAIWNDHAGPPEACSAVRRAMSHQLNQHRIASGFASPVTVAAKSGGLLGIVRNEAGVVTFPGGDQCAIAIFTRTHPGTSPDPARIDTAIGQIARQLVDELRARPA